jgi:DNA-binding Xre family transcriptional regulator
MRRRSEIRLSALPDITPGALERIRVAQSNAIDILLDHSGKAWSTLVTQTQSKVTPYSQAERVGSLEYAQQEYCSAIAEAYSLIFDAIASEYLRVDIDAGTYSERLHKVVFPTVVHSMLFRRNDQLILGAIRAKLIEWEGRRRSTATMARRPSGHTRETPEQLIERVRRSKGWTIEKLAGRAGLDIKQVYKVKRGHPVRTDTIQKLAAALECPPGDLIQSQHTFLNFGRHRATSSAPQARASVNHRKDRRV